MAKDCSSAQFTRERSLVRNQPCPSRKSLHDDPASGPQYHSFVGSKAAWEQLPDDGLPCCQAGSPNS